MNDAAEILRAARLIMGSGQVHEVRALDVVTGRNGFRATWYGYFDDSEALAEAVAGFKKTAAGIYITLNPVLPDLLARACNRLIQATGRHPALTTDEHIIRRRWILVDCDPTRPKGISSTEQEHTLAIDRAHEVRTFLAGIGVKNTVLASSGNGAHVLIPVDLPADDDSLAKRVLIALDGRFSDDAVSVDTAVFNPSRISKVYGTFARKGDDVPSRPHRMARLLEVPDDLSPASAGILQEIAAEADAKKQNRPAQAKRQYTNDLPTVDEVRAALRCIPPRPDYSEWVRITSAVLDAVGGDTDLAESLLKKWSPEEEEGEYRKKLANPLERVRRATLFHLARENGYRPDIPRAYVGSSWTPSGDGLASGEPVVAAISPWDDYYDNTDLGNARRFADRFCDDARYCHKWKQWLVWDGRRWERDNTGKVNRMAYELVRDMQILAPQISDDDKRSAAIKWALSSQSANRLTAIVKLAQSLLPVRPDELDSDRFLLNVLNGTIDLRTGRLHPHDRAQLLTKLAPVLHDVSAKCPRWLAFQTEIHGGDYSVVSFKQRAYGYSMTGDVSEHCLFIQFGAGANGKSTEQDTIHEILGDYAQTLRPEVLMERKTSGGASEEEAALKGARFVTASETGSGGRLNEALVKRLTGGDRIRARFLHGHEFEFAPTHKLWLSTNHKPVIRDTTFSIWRRIHLIPYQVEFTEDRRDTGLPEKLKKEASGILNWLIEGCLQWQRDKLQPPQAVSSATQEYRNSMDVLGDFLEEQCVVIEGVKAKASTLYAKYKAWCEENGERAENQRNFGLRMSERGFKRIRASDGFRYQGVGIRAKQESEGRDPF